MQRMYQTKVQEERTDRRSLIFNEDTDKITQSRMLIIDDTYYEQSVFSRLGP